MTRCFRKRKETKNNLFIIILSFTYTLSNVLLFCHILSSFITPKTRAKAPRHIRKASFTVEAVVVVPVFMFAGAAFMGFFQLLDVQIGVAQELMDEARAEAASYVAEDTDGESLGEDGEDEYVTLTKEYSVSLPVSFFGISELPVVQSVSCRKWIGDTAGEGDEDSDSEYVYITATGSAYHKTASCSYLDLSIRSVSVSSLNSLRNEGGHIYYPCSCYEAGSGSAYITDYGTDYHSSLTCSGLKRTITTMEKDEAIAAGYHACSKCVG